LVTHGDITNYGSINSGGLGCSDLYMNNGNITGFGYFTNINTIYFMGGIIESSFISGSHVVLNLIGSDYKLLAGLWNTTDLFQHFNGELHLGGTIQFGYDSIPSGAIIATNASLISVPNMYASLRSYSNLYGTLTLDGIDFFNNGIIGGSQHSSHYNFTDTTLRIVDASLVFGESSQLFIKLTSADSPPSLVISAEGHSFVLLNGSIYIQLEDGYMPSKGTKFDIITASGSTKIEGRFTRYSVRRSDLSSYECNTRIWVVSSSHVAFVFEGCASDEVAIIVGVVVGFVVLATGAVVGFIMYRRRRSQLPTL